MKMETLQDLYVEQLRDMYSAETQLVKALPKMAKAASHEQLTERVRNPSAGDRNPGGTPRANL